MIRPLLCLSSALILLAACSSTPGKIRQGQTSGSPSGNGQIVVPPQSGPVIEANVERLYPNKKLFLCGGSVSNAPSTDSAREVLRYSRLIVVDGKKPLVTAPANNACISSGFGMRTLNGRTREHKGLDIAARPASRVFSAGAGKIIESGYNGGYGLTVLIDHGDQVYTRYAHLNYVEPNIKVGETVHYGEPLGLMGKSGHVTGIHLHYEILTGNYVPGAWGRGLTPRDPFSFPEWVDPRLAMLDQ